MARTRASLADLPTDPIRGRAALALAGPCLSFGGRHHSDTCAGISRLRRPVDQSHPKIRINISKLPTDGDLCVSWEGRFRVQYSSPYHETITIPP